MQELIKENRALKTLQKRQDRALSKYVTQFYEIADCS